MGRSRLAWKSLGVSRTCLSGSMEASERSEASHSVGLMPDGQLGLLQGLLRTECCRVLAHVPGFGFHVPSTLGNRSITWTLRFSTSPTRDEGRGQRGHTRAGDVEKVGENLLPDFNDRLRATILPVWAPARPACAVDPAGGPALPGTPGLRNYSPAAWSLPPPLASCPQLADDLRESLPRGDSSPGRGRRGQRPDKNARSRWRRFQIRVQSKNAARTLRTQRSAHAFARGTRTGVFTSQTTLASNAASKLATNMASRSRRGKSLANVDRTRRSRCPFRLV
jgi:hypothetical protein